MLSCFEVDVKKGKKEKLVKIRNPHGQTEWKGDWSDNSPLWTKDVEYQVGGRVKKNDGTFFMSFKDYYNVFESTAICKYNDEFINSTQEFKFEGENSNLLFRF